jgi:chemotaxis protein MotB
MSDQDLEGLSDKPNEQPGTGLAASGTGKPKPSNNKEQATANAAKAVPGKDQQLSQAQITEQQLAEAQAAKEQADFEKAQAQLKQAINSIPELAKLADSLLVDNTPEGLRIQIVDQEGLAMFPSGSADMYGHTHALLNLVGRVIKQLPEKISISGHTDSVPFTGQNNYTNWELSADRALAARRVLTGEGGVPKDRVERVVGRADTEPLLKDDPTNPRNRRLTIVLLRKNPSGGPKTVDVTDQQLKTGDVPAPLKPVAAPATEAPAKDGVPAATGTLPAKQ